jgi:hypothetical protein
MTVTAIQVSSLYAQRKLAAGPQLARMAEVQQLYNNDIVVPLPELNQNERSSIPNRVKQGLTQFAERIASSVPQLVCPALRPGFKISEDRAHDRRRAMLGWWEFSRLPLRMRQRARYLQGYASAPVEICWDFHLGVPVYEERNPLTTFPSHMRSIADMTPHDCIFENTQDLGWLYDNYPDRAGLLFKGDPAADGTFRRDRMFTTLKYVDDQECVLVVLGQRTADTYTTPPPGSMAVELERYPNRSERCPVAIPRMFSLDRAHGQFDDLYGMHQTEAKLTALSIIATQRGVIQDEWLVAHPNEEPVIVQIPKDDGTPGIVKGGQLINRSVDPQFQTNNTVDRLAAAQNQSAGLTSELQGVAGSNIRTGARASTLLSNVIDFPIQEGQEILAASLQEENKIAVAFAKAYGDGPKSFHISWAGAKGPVTYNPTETFETDHNIVRYPLGGADMAGMVIAGGQRVGMGTMSKQTFMGIDPMVEDAEAEHDSIVAEKLEEALLSGIQQKVATGELDALYVAELMDLIRSNKVELAAAYKQVQQEAQERQAAMAAQAGAPETQPGLAGPPQMQNPGSIQGAPNVQGLAEMLHSLRGPQQQMTSQEVGAA